MKILVLGGSGMLGHRLCLTLSKRQEVWATFQGRPDQYARYNLLPEGRMVGGVDAGDWQSVVKAIAHIKPDAVVNAIGIVKQRDEAKQAVPSITINSLFPHKLAGLCRDAGFRLYQVSTDCVFSGFRGGYEEKDIPDPVDLYGRTKLLGEVAGEGCLTVRTSIIGWELRQRAGLLEWFASQRGRTIKGFGRAIYSGVSTTVLSELIGRLIETKHEINGIYHVASAPISKYALLVGLKDRLGWKDITIERDEDFYCDRSLSGRHFEGATGWKAPSWEKMIEGLASEWPLYEDWRRTEK
jgi:dTDP-4-dehydrorhamnose reductase